MSVEKAFYSIQSQLFEVERMIREAKKTSDNLAMDYVNNAKYIERLEAEKRRMRG